MSAEHFSYKYTTIAPCGDYWRSLRRLAALEILSPARMASFASTRKTELMLLLREMMRKGTSNGGSAKVDLNAISAELNFNMLSMTLAGKRYYGENAADDEDARKTKILIKEILDLVDERRQILSAGRIRNGIHGQAEKPTMIDHLLSLQKDEPEYYTDQLIKGIVMILLIAVTDTVSITMEWAMALLLNHPEAIKKIKAEIDAHVPQNRLLEEKICLM